MKFSSVALQTRSICFCQSLQVNTRQQRPKSCKPDTLFYMLGMVAMSAALLYDSAEERKQSKSELKGIKNHLKELVRKTLI